MGLSLVVSFRLLGNIKYIIFIDQFQIMQNLQKQKQSMPPRNITPNYLRFKKKSLIKKQGPEEQHDNKASQKSSSRASRCSFQVYEKRILNLSKLRNTLAIKKKTQQERPNSNDIEKRPTSYENKNTQLDTYLQGQNLVYVPKKIHNNNIIILRKRSTGSGNLIIPKSKERLSNGKRNEESLQKEEQRARIQNTQLMTNLMKHQQHLPNYVNKLKIKKQETNQTNHHPLKKPITLTTKLRRNFFSDPSIQLKNEEALAKYQLHSQLGKGAYGVVRMAVDKSTKQKYAMKIYQKSRLDEPNKIKNIQREISILSKLSHSSISRILQTIQTPTELYLVLEYGGANSLYKFLLSKQEHRLAEKEAKVFFKTIIQAIGHLHSKYIVHRDIKAQNILLNRYKQLKLIDFGFSLYSRPPDTIDTFCGTPTYMAPEIVSKRDHVALYTDLWSLGVLYYVMLQGNYPFRAKTQSQLFQKIKRGHYEYIHDDISDKSKQIIRGLLQVNPLQRLSIEKLLQKEWLQWYSQ